MYKIIVDQLKDYSIEPFIVTNGEDVEVTLMCSLTGELVTKSISPSLEISMAKCLTKLAYTARLSKIYGHKDLDKYMS